MQRAAETHSSQSWGGGIERLDLDTLAWLILQGVSYLKQIYDNRLAGPQPNHLNDLQPSLKKKHLASSKTILDLLLVFLQRTVVKTGFGMLELYIFLSSSTAE